MNTFNVARGILAAIQPVMGPAATGALLVRSTSATGTLPAGSVALPVVDGALTEEGAVFAQKNPATADGSWAVTSAGVAVTVEALLGGTPANLPPIGTEYRWDPPVTGVESTSESSSAVTGGSFSGAFGGLLAAKHYKDLGGQIDAGTFFRAQLAQFPGVVLSWSGSTPLDGANAARPGPRSSRTGRGKILYRHEWLLWVVTSRLDSASSRTREGDVIRDDLMEMLTESRCVRGVFQVSNSPGLEILDARPFAVTPTSYVDLLRLGTTNTLVRRNTATYTDWLNTRLRQQTDEQDDEKLDLPDVTIPMV
jgi:hypothetical protein